MEPIHEGATGAAVEDIQERLASLGYDIEKGERDARAFAQKIEKFDEIVLRQHKLGHDCFLFRILCCSVPKEQNHVSGR